MHVYVILNLNIFTTFSSFLAQIFDILFKQTLVIKLTPCATTSIKPRSWFILHNQSSVEECKNLLIHILRRCKVDVRLRGSTPIQQFLSSMTVAYCQAMLSMLVACIYSFSLSCGALCVSCSFTVGAHSWSCGRLLDNYKSLSLFLFIFSPQSFDSVAWCWLSLLAFSPLASEGFDVSNLCVHFIFVIMTWSRNYM